MFLKLLKLVSRRNGQGASFFLLHGWIYFWIVRWVLFVLHLNFRSTAVEKPKFELYEHAQSQSLCVTRIVCCAFAQAQCAFCRVETLGSIRRDESTVMFVSWCLAGWPRCRCPTGEWGDNWTKFLVVRLITIQKDNLLGGRGWPLDSTPKEQSMKFFEWSSPRGTGTFEDASVFNVLFHR